MPVVLLVFGLVVAFSRTTTATEHVAHAAAAGARAAVSAQTAGGATALASDVVADSLAQVGMSCEPPAVAGTFTPGGSVTVTVSCTVDLGDVTRFGAIPGSRTLDGVGDGGHRPDAGWRPVTRRTHGERGSVSLLVVIMVPALLMAAGLVLDGGRQLQARRETAAAAAVGGPGGCPDDRAGGLRAPARSRAWRRHAGSPSSPHSATRARSTSHRRSSR